MIIAWLSRDNVINIALSNDGILINHSLITRILLFFGSTIIDSAITPTTFDLTNVAKVVFKPRLIPIIPGTYAVSIVTYDSSNPDGIAWGNVSINVKQG